MNIRTKVGAGLLAAGAAAAGYYFYGSKNAKHNRRIAAQWTADFKNAVVDRARRLKNLNREPVLSAINTTARSFARAGRESAQEINAAAQELRQNWRKLASEVKREVKKGGRAVSKA